MEAKSKGWSTTAKGWAPGEGGCFVNDENERCRGRATGARGSRGRGYGEQEGGVMWAGGEEWKATTRSPECTFFAAVAGFTISHGS